MQQKVRLFIIGMVMGAAEVVPGVSGGTIAFITGIYERLLNGIKCFKPSILLNLKDKGIVKTWQEVDATFLLLLFAGMGLSILLFARGVGYLLLTQPIFIWSFFFGLVLASVWLVGRQISCFGWDLVLWVCLGAGFGIFITSLAPLQLAPGSLFIFCAGAVAVCAWILPGLSGSFILLILGLYHHLIEAIRSFDLVFLFTLAAGMVIGIVSFAHVLSDLLAKYKNQTLSVLTGFMLGSLVKLWPWKQTLSYQLKPDGQKIPLIQEPISPLVYADLTGGNIEPLMASVGLLLGLISVVGLNVLANYKAVSRATAE
ncbi:MAG: DUF368 domain-containing protein [Pseudomonadales bacterium]|nr:DUF368 domain-containing protein [Pseudomonadales bacterium]